MSLQPVDQIQPYLQEIFGKEIKIGTAKDPTSGEILMTASVNLDEVIAQRLSQIPTELGNQIAQVKVQLTLGGQLTVVRLEPEVDTMTVNVRKGWVQV